MFAGFAQSLGGFEADVREVDVFDDARLDQGAKGSVVGRQKEQGTTENVDGVCRHACGINSGMNLGF